MAFLKTDSGEYRQLPVPSVLSIGRSNTNHIRPSSNQSKSVSGNHAQLILSYIPNSDKIEAFIEDLDSRFGTYVGYSPLEIEKITGRKKILFGQYIRLGHSANYFQFLDKIPSNVDVLPQEIIVSPSKEFHKDLMNHSLAKQNIISSNSQMNSQSYTNTNSREPSRSSRLDNSNNNPDHIGTNMLMANTHSRSNSPSNVFYNNQQQSQYQPPPSQQQHQQHQMKTRFSDEFEQIPHYDPNYNNQVPPNAQGGQYYEDESPRNMQISVNYPTAGQSLKHPVSIYIDPSRDTDKNNNFNRNSRQIDRDHQGRGRSLTSSSVIRGNKTVSPIAEGRYEQYSPEAQSLSLQNINYSSNEYNKSIHHDNMEQLNHRDQYNMESSESFDQHFSQLQPQAPTTTAGVMYPNNLNTSDSYQNYPNNMNSSNRTSMNHTSNEYNDYNNNYNPRRDRYKDIDTINTIMNSNNYMNKNNPLDNNQSPSKQPKPVYESMEALKKLMKKSTNMQETSKLSKYSLPDPAINSSYYHDRLNSINKNNSNKSILKTSKHTDYQAKLGDNGILMEAIQPSKVNLIRRSWPDELKCPSSTIIARFVDHLLAQELGSTDKEYVLYQDIYRGKHQDKDNNLNLDRYPSFLSELRLNPVKCDLPVVIPDSVLSEAIVESISDDPKSTTIGMLGIAVKGLNDLLRQCLLGVQIDPRLETSVDFDRILLDVLSNLIKNIITQLDVIHKSNIVKALELPFIPSSSAVAVATKDKSKPTIDIRSNIGLMLQQSIDSLTRINSFLNGKYLKEESQAIALNTEHMYEIVALAISNILNKLDACSLAIWSITQRADEVTMEHVVNKSGGFLKASLTLELEELRKMKKDSDLTPLVDRIRQQEANILERKLMRFHKVFEILLGFNLKSAIWKWKHQIKAMKRYELALMDLQDKCHVNTKRIFFKDWYLKYKIHHTNKKILKRFGRVIGSKGEFQLRRVFKLWSNNMISTKESKHANHEIAKLRVEICNLKATLHNLINQDEIAASLAAEKALNRELSSMNLELRQSIQQMEEKLLECGSAPPGKRKDLVYHYLIQKEEELAESKRENKFLHSELEHLRLLATRRLLPNNNKNIPSTHQPSQIQHSKQKANPISSSRPGAYANYNQPGKGINPNSNPQANMKYDPTRYKSTVENPKDIAFMMSKEEAKIVILSEVRRLKESHALLKTNRDQLNNKMIEETNRNVQLTIGLQSLQNRLTAIERSANALRELLKQKFGEQGIIHMIEALENLGAGCNVLLDVPVSSTLNEISHTNAPPPSATNSNSNNNKDINNYSNNSNSYFRDMNTNQIPNNESKGTYFDQQNKPNFTTNSNNKTNDDNDNRYSKAIENVLYR